MTPHLWPGMYICLHRPHWWRCRCTPPNHLCSGYGSCTLSRLSVHRRLPHEATGWKEATRISAHGRGGLVKPDRSSPRVCPGLDASLCKLVPQSEGLKQRGEGSVRQSYISVSLNCFRSHFNWTVKEHGRQCSETTVYSWTRLSLTFRYTVCSKRM